MTYFTIKQNGHWSLAESFHKTKRFNQINFMAAIKKVRRFTLECGKKRRPVLKLQLSIKC